MSIYTNFTMFTIFRFTFLFTVSEWYLHCSSILFGYNFCWIPSYFSIHWNNEADNAVKSALELENVTFKIYSTDFKYFIKLYNSFWYICCVFCGTSKLYSIQNKVNMPNAFHLRRCQQVIISRSRIHYSNLTHTTWVHILWLSFDFES